MSANDLHNSLFSGVCPDDLIFLKFFFWVGVQAQQFYVSLKAHDEGSLGTQALVLALERLNNLTLPTSK